MLPRLHSNARVTACQTLRLLGLKSTVACIRIVNAHSPQEIRLLWALLHDSTQAHMVVVFSASTIGVLSFQGKAGLVQECDAHSREQCNACQLPMLYFRLVSSTISCTSRLEHNPFYPLPFLSRYFDPAILNLQEAGQGTASPSFCISVRDLYLMISTGVAHQGGRLRRNECFSKHRS